MKAETEENQGLAGSILSTPSTSSTPFACPPRSQEEAAAATGRPIDLHDGRRAHCRRLGHEVTFGYCRQENQGAPCRLILDCWWERFDVRAFLEENLPPDDYAAIASGSPPPNKMAALFDLIQKARERAGAAPSSSGKDA